MESSKSSGNGWDCIENRDRYRAILNVIEVNVAVFAFLLNFAWEILQGGLYLGFNELSYQQGVNYCIQATFADTGIIVVSFWLVAWIGGGRNWPLRSGIVQIVGFTSVGSVTTIVLEILPSHVWDRWSYTKSMLVIPILDVGVTPFLQWVLLPPLTIWFVRRQVT